MSLADEDSIAFRMALAGSKIDCFHLLSNDALHSIVRWISHIPAIRWYVQAKSVQLNLIDFDRRLLATGHKSNPNYPRNQRKEHQELREKFQSISWCDEMFRSLSQILPTNLNSLAFLNSFEITFTSSSSGRCFSNRDEDRKPWNRSLAIGFNVQ